MSRLRWGLYITLPALAACAQTCPVVTPPPPPPVPIAVEAPKPSTRQEAASALTKRLTSLRQQEIAAANAASDADTISRVRELDKAASTALARVTHDPNHASPRTMADARQAVGELAGYLQELQGTQ
jgi:type IV secretory pathway VirB10-like protein